MNQEENTSTVGQLLHLFNSMFSKENLRKNVYIFNAINQKLIILVKIIARERRVAQITSNHALIVEALKQCQYIQMKSQYEAKVLLQGEKVLVRLKSEKENISKKEINALTRQMKCHYQEEKDGFLIEFQSHAAVVEFLQRVKSQKKQFQYQILEKDPYKCLEQAVSNYRKERKNERNHQTMQQQQQQPNPQFYYYQQYLSELSAYYPVFVRRAVDSDEQENGRPYRSKGRGVFRETQQKKEEKKVELKSEEFPSFEELSLEAKQTQ